MGARNKGEILSNYGGSATKLGMPREFPTKQARWHVEEGYVGLKNAESANKGEVGPDLGKPKIIFTLSECNKCDLKNLHEIEILQAEECEGGNQSTQA